MTSKSLKIIALFCLLFSVGQTLLFAADDLTEQAQKEISTQSETFRERPSDLLPKKEIKLEIAHEEEPPASEEEGQKFFVREIHIEDNTVFPIEELQGYAKSYENRESSFGELKQLCRLITNHYRSRGYIVSRAYLPPQKLQDGRVVIKVAEAKIGKVVVEGNQYSTTESYTDRMQIRKDRILNYMDLEKNLYFLNQHADTEAKVYLVPGNTPTFFDLIIKAKEKNPFHAYYEFNNRGSKLTHRARNGASILHTNLTKHSDSLYANFNAAEEGAFQGGSMVYEFPLLKTGTSLSLSGSYVESLLVKHLKHFEVKGESSTIVPGITQDFIRTPWTVFQGYVGLEIKDSKTLIDDIETNYDRLRVLKAGPRLTLQDAGGRSVFTGDVHLGIPDFLGGLGEDDPEASRENTGGKFIYYTANAIRIQKLPAQSFLILRGSGQWSRDKLLSLEQFRAGGVYSVRGYPESESLGDYGYLASSEVMIPLPWVPKDWRIPFTDEKWSEVVRLAGFIDAGKTYNLERSSPSEVKDKFLLGTGFGVRINMKNDVSIRFDLGFPIGDDSSDKNNPQAHISAQIGF